MHYWVGCAQRLILFVHSASLSLSSAEVPSAPRPGDRDRFFERLLVGGAVDGKITLELEVLRRESATSGRTNASESDSLRILKGR